jgi:hypothetical protein
VSATAADLLARYVDQHVATGVAPDLGELCRGHESLLPELRALVERYEGLRESLRALDAPPGPDGQQNLPTFTGFRTLERLGRGGAGDVFKLEDETLGRVVAAKVLRPDSPLLATVADFLREARALALFDDPRVVRLLEYRPGDTPVLLMEYVDGFPLDEIGPSLSFPQRARLLAQVAQALHRAHGLGLQHRDLKPGHVLVDARLQPKILDFGLSRGEPDRGHGVGTPAYMAPEQLDASRPIDARSDVYALGVILYELLCGRRPEPCAGPPSLPSEIDPAVPEPLQAIALQAMSTDPGDRYRSAGEMAIDLELWLEGRPVQARPTAYRCVLEQHVAEHLAQVDEWQRARLVYPHEGERLRAAYRPLQRREDDWIVASRVLSSAQIALYVGAFLLASASVLYLTAYLREAVSGLLQPTLALLVPFAALSGAAHLLYRRERRAVAVAFALGAAALLPLAIAIGLREAGWFVAPAGAPDELFSRIGNRQLQLALGCGCAWLCLLGARTRTVGLSSGAAAALIAWHLSLLGDFGLRRWLDDGRYDLLAFGLVPLAVFTLAAGWATERRGLPWFAEPLHFVGVALAVLVLELLALDGRALRHLGVTLASADTAKVSDAHLLDTVAVMMVNGILAHVAGILLERHGTPLQGTPARLLYAASPFLTLEPLADLVSTGEYSRRFDWLYLLSALVIAFLAQRRQRPAFFFAGLLNAAVGLYFLTDHYDWYARPAWPLAILAGGALGLSAGLALDWRQRNRRARSAGVEPTRSGGNRAAVSSLGRTLDGS